MVRISNLSVAAKLLWKTNARHVKEKKKGKNFENLIVKKKAFPSYPMRLPECKARSLKLKRRRMINPEKR